MPRLMEPIRLPFYTVAVNFDTLTSLLTRFGSGGYYVALTELLLIGLLVNWCAGVLHGTRGTRLLRGLLIVLVAATLVVRLLADQLGWTRLDLLYHYFIIGMAFVALVAFQPELRRALIRAGELPFLRRPMPQSRLISRLVESAGYLSRNRFGALIAIQRDVGLANWAENGTQLNAEVSANLLNSVFYPNSALHDLGMIIRGNRVLAAGCQFPVAESGELVASLGSRHRAAVGLSAESDALVLVVSEETGT
ncbi:MAG: diadenylate cyclase, partial [Phycisphaerae bacterium]